MKCYTAQIENLEYKWEIYNTDYFWQYKWKKKEYKWGKKEEYKWNKKKNTNEKKRLFCNADMPYLSRKIISLRDYGNLQQSQSIIQPFKKVRCFTYMYSMRL